MAKESKKDKLARYIKEGHRWIFTYENGAFISYCTEERAKDIVEMIMWFENHYNSTLCKVFDTKEQKTYEGKENDEPDIRGHYNFSYYNDKGEKVFDCDTMTAPLTKIKPIALDKSCKHGYFDRDGKFYECGFQCHIYLAEELFLTGTIECPVEYKHKQPERRLEEMGWIKISDSRILFTCRKLSPRQQKALIRWMAIMGKKEYEFNRIDFNVEEIEDQLNNEFNKY